MKKYYLKFLLFSFLITLILFLIPINLFDGEMVFEVNGVTFVEKAKLSLSYFIGIGAGKRDLIDVKDFYLLPMGYFFCFIVIIGLPAIISYRIYLHDKKKS